MLTPDTADLRTGAPLHEALLALLPLVGVWSGDGTGVSPHGSEFRYGQQLQFVHDGRPFLAYESRAWLLDADGGVLRQAWRESGFWRPGAGEDDVEVVLASNTGEALVYAGVAGDLTWELATTSAQAAATAKAVDGERRFYALVGETLAYATELAPAGAAFAPHLNARLERV
ncbi:FABP family protein [Jatrophihabitans sp.]|uniref:FABP family protein n=1 Tax=Jatrophihabitans sp. TaxID=1932789 RepID=UPI0030C6AD24|nr:hypothetical protein [Jatrophihabitans sp.]